ncbi:hypothetical protein KAI46_01710, partial [bacterium]|nr:hypothetical protein [bacterium]
MVLDKKDEDDVMRSKKLICLIALFALATTSMLIAGPLDITIYPGWDIYTEPGGVEWFYRYGPSIIINNDDSIDVWTAGVPGAGGSGQADWIYHKKSTDGGHTWGSETVALRPTAGSEDAWSCCDPGVIKFGGYYYIGYTSSENTAGYDNHVYVARSTTPTPYTNYQKWNGSGWGGNPVKLITYTGTAGQWGAGEPSFVLKDGTIYVYYTWKDGGDQMRLSTADASNPNWPGALTYQGVVLDGKVSGEDSCDVKYIDSKEKFISVSVCQRFTTSSYIKFRESTDGTNFTTPVEDISEYTMPEAHNGGISGTEDCHIDLTDDNFISYAYGPTWGLWNTYLNPIDLGGATIPPPPNSLVAHYKLDETSGTTAVDSTGRNNGTIIGSGPTWTDGAPDGLNPSGALDFPGGDGDFGYVDCGNASLDITGSRTVAAWVKIDAWGADWTGVITKGDVPGNYDLIRNGSSNNLGFYIADSAGGFCVGDDNVADGQWHHVTGVYDSAGMMYMYVDGVLDASISVTGGATTMNNQPLVLNGLNDGNTGWDNTRHIDGKIDDVRIYNYVLSASEIAYLAGAAAPGAASNPSPENEATSVAVDTSLSWTAGSDATSHTVYFGQDSTPDSGELQGNQPGTTFDPGTMTKDTTYFWRV